MVLPEPLRQAIEKETRSNIVTSQRLSGGDINEALKIEFENGNSFFLKYNSASFANEMLNAEAKGLQLLSENECIKIPSVAIQSACEGYAYLLLELIPAGIPGTDFWQKFATQLCCLHKISADTYGLAFDNYIGTLPQKNTRHPDWISFYANCRLQPQIKMATDNNLLTSSESKKAIRLVNKLDRHLTQECPALIHGDLWNGNFLVDKQGLPCLIDPAVAFAHREMDIAMMRLFGGFDHSLFARYHELWPLENGWEQRIELYQLYFLLVHVNLFGRGYTNGAMRIIDKFL